MKSLVTVVKPDEAKILAEHSPDIVDIKNPGEGSLGAPDYRTAAEIVKHIPDSMDVSIALGDIPMLPGTVSMAVRGVAELEPDYIKIGLKGPQDRNEAERLLEDAVKPVAQRSSRVVAAAYADHASIGSVSPIEAVEAASGIGLETVMIDTLSKEGTIFDFMSTEELEKFVNEADRQGLETALAGSIKVDDLEKLRSIGADIVGVRGAVCSGDRESELSEEQLESFLDKF